MFDFTCKKLIDLLISFYSCLTSVIYEFINNYIQKKFKKLDGFCKQKNTLKIAITKLFI